jgi:HEAT repeat protein
MDPNEALKDARQAIVRWRALEQYALGNIEFGEAACDLIDAFEALDEWLSAGGFLPTDWRKTCAP